MILAAALLVLVALGLFVAGLLTGVTTWYWACVAVSALAAVLLIAARRQLSRAGTGDREPATVTAAMATGGGSTAAGAREQQPSPREPEPAEPVPAPAASPEASSPPSSPPPSAPAAPEPAATAAATDSADGGDPAPEEVEVTDLLLVVDMHDDVFVVDEHPRYHLADCRWLASREAIPIPVNEARTDGFTPCAVCSPDKYLAQVARARKASTT